MNHWLPHRPAEQLPTCKYESREAPGLFGEGRGKSRQAQEGLVQSNSMPTEQMLALLIAERDPINRAVEALGATAGKRRRRPPGSKNGQPAAGIKKDQAVAGADNHICKDGQEEMDTSPAGRGKSTPRSNVESEKEREEGGLVWLIGVEETGIIYTPC